MRSVTSRSTDDMSGHRTRFGAHNTILDKPPTAVLTWLEEHSRAVEQFDEELKQPNTFHAFPTPLQFAPKLPQA